jgi:hypothetical protein
MSQNILLIRDDPRYATGVREALINSSDGLSKLNGFDAALRALTDSPARESKMRGDPRHSGGVGRPHSSQTARGSRPSIGCFAQRPKSNTHPLGVTR